MPRSARIVLPAIPHHVTQRGNRRQEIFLRGDDWSAYRGLLAAACARHGVECLAWCLMPNHVHLILVPGTADALRAVLASTHTAYSQRINQRDGLSGHLFQGRFASYPMDQAHLLAAIRYVENNPVKAGLVERAEDWNWSSARTHLGGGADGLTGLNPLRQSYPNWRQVLEVGWEAGTEEIIDQALASGKPIGQADWIVSLGKQYGIDPQRRDRGRPKKGTVPFSQ